MDERTRMRDVAAAARRRVKARRRKALPADIDDHPWDCACWHCREALEREADAEIDAGL